MNLDLSIGIITLNTEKTLENTLRSICFVNEIIVVDNGSIDKTVEIAHSYNAKVYTHTVKDQKALREFALSKCKTEWMLFLDADEFIDNISFKEVLQDWKINKNSFSGFWIKRKNFYGDTQSDYFKYGLFYPDYQLRLIRKKTTYINTPHEEPNILLQKTKKIKDAYISHYPDKRKLESIFGFIHLFHFTRSYGKHLIDKTVGYLLIMAFARFFDLFVISLIRGKGILDGWRGLFAAWNFSIHITSIYIYAVIIKLQRRQV